MRAHVHGHFTPRKAKRRQIGPQEAKNPVAKKRRKRNGALNWRARPKTRGCLLRRRLPHQKRRSLRRRVRRRLPRPSRNQRVREPLLLEADWVTMTRKRSSARTNLSKAIPRPESITLWTYWMSLPLKWIKPVLEAKLPGSRDILRYVACSILRGVF